MTKAVGTKQQQKIEIVAPAGNLEKLKVAVLYGADAVYVGMKQFGMRAFADNFTCEEIHEGLAFAHQYGKKLYVTLNIFAHDEDFDGLANYMRFLDNEGVDAIIVADVGVMTLAKEIIPQMPLHLSTQANTLNARSALFYHENGISRLVLARELSFSRIENMRKAVSSSLVFEAFVHGAMCISYSGRCLMSRYLVGTGRDANTGECSQPCRWNYALVEEKRPGQYLPIAQDERGTYIMYSKDLCMIGHIPAFIKAGVTALKIEGRMKSPHYVASTVKAYRQAIDSFYKDPEHYAVNDEWQNELNQCNHRQYTNGFYLGNDTIDTVQPEGEHPYTRGSEFAGIVYKCEEKGTLIVEQRSPFAIGDNMELLMITGENIRFTLDNMQDAITGERQIIAAHPKQMLKIPFKQQISPYTILRKTN